MNRALDIAAAIPILAAYAFGQLLVGLAATPAIALAVWRVERVMSDARRDGDGPW